MPSVHLFCRIVMVLTCACRSDVHQACGDLLDEIVDLGQLGAQPVVHVDRVLATGLLVRGVAAFWVGCRPGWAARSSQRCWLLRRLPSSGVGLTATATFSPSSPRSRRSSGCVFIGLSLIRDTSRLRAETLLAAAISNRYGRRSGHPSHE